MRGRRLEQTKGIKNSTVAFIFVIGVFLILQAPLYKPLLSDENQYFYLGKLVADGKAPYVDFFYAHPPFQLAVFGVMFKVMDFNVYVFKWIALASTLITAILLYFLSGKHTKVLIPALYLFTSSVFFTGAVNMGINITTMLVVLGYFLLMKNEHFLGGMMFGVASLSGLYSLVIFMALALYLWRNSFFFVAGMLFISIPFNALFSIFTKNEYMRQVYLYHLSKPIESASSKLTFIMNTLSMDLIIWLPLFFVILVLIYKRKSFVNPLAYCSIAYIVFLLLLHKPFNYYWIMVYPFMALLVSEGIESIKRWKLTVILGMTAFSAFMAFNVFSGVEHFNEESQFSRMNEMSLYFKRQSGKVLFGDYTITSLIALNTNKEMVVSKHFDTYPTAFAFIGIEKALRVLEESKPDYLLIHRIANTQNPIWEVQEIKEYLDSHCNFEGQPVIGWSENANEYLVYRCS